MSRFILLVVVFLNILISSCKKTTQHQNPSGLWRAELLLTQNNTRLPFFIEFIKVNDSIKAAIYNAGETIVHDDIFWRNDSLVISSPYFNSSIIAVMDENKMSGYWIDSSRGFDYKLTFEAKYNLPHRFSFSDMPNDGVDGIWQTVFSPGTEDAYPAIGIFGTDENSTSGTFLTETGDYRFLEGGFGNDTLKLSAFDGSHAFLFQAALQNDTLKGWFYSGSHHKEPFIAWRNDSARLQDPYTLTKLNSRDEKVKFTAKDLDGNVIAYPSNRFEGKPLVIQVMGSWCPNCLDESVFLTSKYDEIRLMGIEIVGIAFERLSFEQAIPVLSKLKKNLNIPYSIFYAGMASKSGAKEVLPFLESIKSYPTLIFVKPNGEIFKIHTGFYGPGTGSYFKIQSKEMMDDFRLLSKLSLEKKLE